MSSKHHLLMHQEHKLMILLYGMRPCLHLLLPSRQIGLGLTRHDDRQY